MSLRECDTEVSLKDMFFGRYLGSDTSTAEGDDILFYVSACCVVSSSFSVWIFARHP